MLLSKPAILRRIADGSIVADPFVPENLGSAQLDVTLGEYFYVERMRGQGTESELSSGRCNPYSEQQVRDRWSLHRAPTHEVALFAHELEQPLEGVGLDERIMLIRPGETVLAHTREFVGGRGCVTTKMQARSSLGRCGISVCKCAGMGDVGFVNRWTLEITNHSRWYSFPLVVGRRIAQILFFEVESVGDADAYGRDGKYQVGDNLERIKAAWTPEQMLPRMWLDRECAR